MDRNFILAFLLSSFVIFFYYGVFPPDPVKKPAKAIVKNIDASSDVQNTKTEATQTKEATLQNPSPITVETIATPVVTIETPLYSLTIDTLEGVAKSFYLKKYHYAGPDHINAKDWVKSIFSGDLPTKHGIDPNRLVNMIGDVAPGLAPWQINLKKDSTEPISYQASQSSLNVESGARSLTLIGTTKSGMIIQKELIFHSDSYVVEMEVFITNKSGTTQIIEPKIHFGAGNEMVKTESYPHPKEAAWSFEGATEWVDAGDLEDPLEIPIPKWAAVTSAYFVQGVMSKGEQEFKLAITPVASTFRGDETLVPHLYYADATRELQNGSNYNRNFKVYMGPKQTAELEKMDMSFPAAIYIGWLEIIGHPILALLRWLQSLVHNWGIAIIILTILVRSAMFPLAFKGMKGMKKMAQLNPRMKQIKDKYKNNKEKLNLEIMNLYKKNNINPMAGCLPLLLQVPIFIALYQALLPAIELRHQSFFFWVDNLSASDHTLVLPVLMGISMYVQQHLTPQPNMEPMQAKMMKWMPVMLIFFFLDMPMGLVLYWVASNVFTIFQQLIFNRVQIDEIQH
ncbi:MAG: membrane protein insertase YidC [SAR324 cluster bacterium]|nr:membrane protein insertase YidC [SAR324 cluster bacterium]